MPIRGILETEYGPVFGPEDITAITAAFQAALTEFGLGMVDRNHPLRTRLATLIIQLAKDGERDPQKLCEGALKTLAK